VPSGFLWISFCANFVFVQILFSCKVCFPADFADFPQIFAEHVRFDYSRDIAAAGSKKKSASPASSAFPIQIRVIRVIRVPYPNPRHPRHPRSPRSKKTAFHEQNAGICISCASNTFILQNHGPSRRQTKIY
jgi:hypothetical protein